VGFSFSVNGVGVLIEESHQARERWVVVLTSKLCFNLVERLVILQSAGLYGIVFRSVRLNDDAAGIVTTSGTACHLAQQLKGALPGPEVGQVETKVG
jgi:hypothetical protein